MIITGSDILLYITFILLNAVAFRAFFLRRMLSRQIALVAMTTEKLDKAASKIEELKHIEKQYNTFSSDLQQAAISSKVQQTPRVLNQVNGNSRPPERYKYVHSLTQQGIGAAEIASILAISPQEADQLVALANLSNNN